MKNQNNRRKLSDDETQKTIDPAAELRKARKLIVKLRKERKEWMESWTTELNEKLRFKNQAKEWEEAYYRLTVVTDRMITADIEKMKREEQEREKEHQKTMARIQTRMRLSIAREDEEMLLEIDPRSQKKYVHPNFEKYTESLFEVHRN
jgi:hypothetical protein